MGLREPHFHQSASERRSAINPLRKWLIGLLYAAPGEAYIDLLRQNHRLQQQIADARRALRA